MCTLIIFQGRQNSEIVSPEWPVPRQPNTDSDDVTRIRLPDTDLDEVIRIRLPETDSGDVTIIRQAEADADDVTRIRKADTDDVTRIRQLESVLEQSLNTVDFLESKNASLSQQVQIPTCFISDHHTLNSI